jgi:hypothetical protein
MRKPWHKSNPELFGRTKQETEKNFPELRLVVENDTVFLRGSFKIEEDGETLDRYLIEVQFPDDYPDAIPIVCEIGGRIPRTADRHISNPKTGEICAVVPEEWLLRPDSASIQCFLSGPVRNFFIGQSLVEQGKPWPFGERGHRAQGLYEAYAELLGVSDPESIRRYLDLLSRDPIRRHWDCPCGNGKRLRDCHLEFVRTLQKKIPPSIAHRALGRLRTTPR